MLSPPHPLCLGSGQITSGGMPTAPRRRPRGLVCFSFALLGITLSEASIAFNPAPVGCASGFCGLSGCTAKTCNTGLAWSGPQSMGPPVFSATGAGAYGLLISEVGWKGLKGSLSTEVGNGWKGLKGSLSTVDGMASPHGIPRHGVGARVLHGKSMLDMPVSTHGERDTFGFVGQLRKGSVLESGFVEKAAEPADLQIGLKLSCGAAGEAAWLGIGLGLDQPGINPSSLTPSLDLLGRQLRLRQQFRYTPGEGQPGKSYHRSTCSARVLQCEGHETGWELSGSSWGLPEKGDAHLQAMVTRGSGARRGHLVHPQGCASDARTDGIVQQPFTVILGFRKLLGSRGKTDEEVPGRVPILAEQPLPDAGQPGKPAIPPDKMVS